MVFYVLTDVAGKHWRRRDGSWVEIERGEPPPESVQRFRTKTEANKRRELLKKRDCHTAVARCNAVLVVVRGTRPKGGCDLVEFKSAAKAKSFQKAMKWRGFEAAIEEPKK